MSQKSIFSKLTALMLASYMVIGNISIVGVGFNKTIAEELETPQVKLEQQVKKYVQYENQFGKGVVLKTKLQIEEDTSSEEQYESIKKVELEVQVPEINGQKPARVNIVENSTNVTNGKTNGEINQDYDSNSGLLTMSYENKDNYSEYKENAKDEFEMLYIYAGEAYTGNENEIVTNTSVKVKVEYNEENKNTEKIENYEIKLKDNVGDISQIETVEVSDIYKGYMYSNEENKTAYETNYTEKETVEVINMELMDNLVINQKESKFILEEDKEGKANIEYKSTIISEEEFRKLLGEDGYIDIYVAENKYATVKYGQADTEGNKKYIVEYANGEQKEEAGKIEYAEGTKEIQIKTSKPMAEGKIELLQEKVIKANQEEKLNDIKGIKELKEVIATKQTTIQETAINENGEKITTEQQIENKINESKEERVIDLKEPITQMSLELSNSNLSTLATNNITATIKLNDTNSSCKLFETGKMEITLPGNLVSAKIVTAKLLYGNGLSIPNVKIENGKVVLIIDGKQTAYDLENISGGVNIVINLEFDIDDTIPSHKEIMELTYANRKVSKNINIISKEGVLLLTKLENYNKLNDSVESVDNTLKTVQIGAEEDERIAIQTINIINNYDKNIENVEIKGKLNYTSENEKSTFNTNLSNAIEINGVEAKVYYTENENQGNWTEEFTNKATAYKIEIINNALLSKKVAQIKLKILLPKEIGYNQENYLNCEVNYTYENNTRREISNVGMYTEKRVVMATENANVVKATSEVTENEKLKIDTEMTVAGEKINENASINEGQIVRCKVTIQNISNEVLKNIKINTRLENAVYYELQPDGIVLQTGSATRYKECSVNDVERETSSYIISSGDSITYEYQIRVREDVETITNRIRILQDNDIIAKKIITNNINKSEIKIEVVNEFNEELNIYSGGKFYFFIKVKNIADSDLSNVIVNCDLPEILEFDPNNSLIYENEKGAFDSVYKENKKIIWRINKLEKGNEIQIPVRAVSKDIDINKTKEKISIVSTVETINSTYISNDYIQTIIQSKANLSCVWINSTYETLKDKGKSTYNITITNNGVIDLNDLYFYLTLGNGLNVINAKLDGQEIETKSLSGVDINTKLEKGDNIDLEVTVEYNKENIEYNTDAITNFLFLTTERGENKELTYIQKVEMRVQEENEEEQEENGGNNQGNNEDNEGNNQENNEGNEENNQNSGNNENDDIDEEEINAKYSISGLAWTDINKNGQREDSEKLASGINVILINRTTGKIVTDEHGNNLTVATDENGIYKFSNLSKGQYLVIFEFDTNTYTVTTYKKEGINSSLNSDAIISNVTIDGNKKLVGITDNIELTDKNMESIDIGLIENAKFDLSLDKQISSITVTNAQGTKTTEYKNKNFAKIDLVAKYMNNTNVIVTYKFVIKNEGEVTGYVDSLVDNLPSGLEFSSELNKDWYKGSDGNLYTTSLSGIAIKPGETSEIELVLTKKTTENTTGTFSNNAEIEKISNLEVIEEKAEAKENNKSSADIVISIKTGSAIMYIGITIGCLAVIGAGAYIIKKKVLDKENIV